MTTFIDDPLKSLGPIDQSGISGELIENGNTGTFMEPESGSLDIETRAMETPELLLGESFLPSSKKLDRFTLDADLLIRSILINLSEFSQKTLFA